MEKLVALHKQTDPDVIKLLRSALSDAESGEITGFAMIAEGRGGDAYTFLTFKDGWNTLGMLNFLAHKMAARLAEGSRAE